VNDRMQGDTGGMCVSMVSSSRLELGTSGCWEAEVWLHSLEEVLGCLGAEGGLAGGLELGNLELGKVLTGALEA